MYILVRLQWWQGVSWLQVSMLSEFTYNQREVLHESYKITTNETRMDEVLQLNSRADSVNVYVRVYGVSHERSAKLRMVGY
jgi:hypothetical protein